MIAEETGRGMEQSKGGGVGWGEKGRKKGQ